MQTHIGTIALMYLAETKQAAIGYTDIESVAIIAERAGWTGRPADRIRLELFAALERDTRFAKGFTHAEINGQTRKVRVFRAVGAPVPVPPATALTLPLDPWRRRLYYRLAARHRPSCCH